MHIVEVSHDRAGGVGEVGRRQAAQEIGRRQSSMDIGHANFDEPAKLKLVAALGDLDRPQFARPGVDVLEQMAVDSAQMGKVKDAVRNPLGHSLRNEGALGAIELIAIAKAEPVSEDPRSRVATGVFGAHSAARGSAFTRI